MSKGKVSVVSAARRTCGHRVDLSSVIRNEPKANSTGWPPSHSSRNCPTAPSPAAGPNLYRYTAPVQADSMSIGTCAQTAFRLPGRSGWMPRIGPKLRASLDRR